MRVVGIIAEYNPFHSGHAYHLAKAKQETGADFAVVVMSPDFVQRGEPAVFGKYTRAKMALLNGADLVLELPVCYASGSAEYFAQGAVSTLDGLGVVDVLCFGCEGTKADGTKEECGPEEARAARSGSDEPAGIFWKTAEVFNREPDAFSDSLRTQLARGVSFPKARELALSAWLESVGGAPLPEGFLREPNNILGIEYCRAILKFQSRMEILPIKRAGSGYHEERLGGRFCSATALRGELLTGKRSFIRGFIPDNLAGLYESASLCPAAADDFLPCFLQKLLADGSFEDILDISDGLAGRMRSLRYRCVGKTYEETAAFLSAKQLTKSHVRRAMLHLILGTGAAQTEQFRAGGPAYYAHVLGFCREASPLLHEIKLRGRLPLLTKNADAAGHLSDTGRAMLRQDFEASHLYRGIQALKYGTPFRSEYEMSPVVI